MNTARCANLPRIALGGTWYRVVPLPFSRYALAHAHTKTTASRFNEGKGAFSTLYFSDDPLVAMFEVEALLGSLYTTWLPLPGRNWATFSVLVSLQSVVDSSQPAVLDRLASSAQELTGDWLCYALRGPSTPVPQAAGVTAPTQELGAALYAIDGIEGFVTISAKVPTQRNLVIFPDKLLSGSSIECRDDKGKLLYRIPRRRRKKGSP